MRTFLRTLLLAIVCSIVAAPPAVGDIGNAGAQNVEEGDNESSNDQGGESRSGDAVAGQVTGVVSAGEAEVDATNHSEDVSLGSGDASGSNAAATFTGINASDTVTVVSDIIPGAAFTAQEGDNASSVTQVAESISGDAIGGQISGVVTSSTGSADIVAANTSTEVEVSTGDADAANDVAAFVGVMDIGPTSITATDIIDPDPDGFILGFAHEGDNTAEIDQSATAATGDGVGGQVLGVVSAGDTSLDATNASDEVDIVTGDALTDNDVATFVGSTIGTETVISADVAVAETFNAQEGDNDGVFVQAATATTGDGVGGQVVGAVTSATGSADIVAANASDDVELETGGSAALNEASAFVGQNGLPANTLTVSDVDSTLFAVNAQEGDNSFAADQSASAGSGDAVLGQVLGVVSAGATSVDATNVSSDSAAETGEAFAANDVAAFVGLTAATGTVVGAQDVDTNLAFNVQKGDNDAEVVQAAAASSGDAVGGQIGGVVTSAGGSADLVLANTSEGTDTTTGDADHFNDALSFTGLLASEFLPAS